MLQLLMVVRVVDSPSKIYLVFYIVDIFVMKNKTIMFDI